MIDCADATDGIAVNAASAAAAPNKRAPSFEIRIAVMGALLRRSVRLAWVQARFCGGNKAAAQGRISSGRHFFAQREKRERNLSRRSWSGSYSGAGASGGVAATIASSA